MEAVRTSDERFADLPGFEWAPAYADVDAGDGSRPVRMAYVDAGPTDGPTVLLLHGQPTWSFLYRHVIEVLVAGGARVVAPDNIGFGRSDKPVSPYDYTLARHVGWTRSLVSALDLRDVTLVCQDWGGPIGLSALAADPGRYAGVVAANTILHTASPDLEGRLAWALHGEGSPGSSSRSGCSTTCCTPSGPRACAPPTSSRAGRRSDRRGRCWRRTTPRSRTRSTRPGCGR